MVENMPNAVNSPGTLMRQFMRDNRAATAIEYSLIAAIAGLALVAFAGMATRTAFTPALDVLGDTLSRQPVEQGGHDVH